MSWRDNVFRTKSFITKLSRLSVLTLTLWHDRCGRVDFLITEQGEVNLQMSLALYCLNQRCFISYDVSTALILNRARYHAAISVFQYHILLWQHDCLTTIKRNRLGACNKKYESWLKVLTQCWVGCQKRKTIQTFKPRSRRHWYVARSLAGTLKV